MSETYEKVLVGDLKVGDMVQLMAFVDASPVRITYVNPMGDKVFFTTDEPSALPYSWNANSVVFKLKKGIDEHTNEENHDPSGEAERG